MVKKDAHLKPISGLFSKYTTTLKPPQKVVVTATIEVVEDLFGVTLKSESLRYNSASRLLNIAATSTLKSEILLKKEEILTHLRGRLGPQGAPKDFI